MSNDIPERVPTSNWCTTRNKAKSKRTTKIAETFDRDRLAKTYNNGISSALPVENVNAFGAGGIYSSAEDLCTFATTFTKNSNGIPKGDGE
ncbi:hypothetical protein G9F73_006115 [Clostridium estertheticum]|uniref:hypothetical protein n=1 Tax=Clostridium estertheticum TaxID=238834 RepID=UPI0013EEA691|nr:hypothetical protein [Clostridium estertheticum]MBZ9607396.1 hypothetical protein [Clostridium estertheticum]